MKHYDIKVAGDVQDVGFRATSCEQARALGLFGFVRNEPDGSVFIEVEGEDGAVGKFIVDIKEGHGNLEIEKTEKQLKGYNSFEVRF